MEKIHPSPTPGIVCGALLLAAVFAFLGAALASLQVQNALFIAVIAGAIAGGSCAALSVIWSLRTFYCIENGALMMQSGFLSLEKKLIPIKNIDNLHIKVSLMGRLFSIADVYVDTPGGDGYEMVMRGIPLKAAEIIEDQVEKARQGN